MDRAKTRPSDALSRIDWAPPATFSSSSFATSAAVSVRIGVCIEFGSVDGLNPDGPKSVQGQAIVDAVGLMSIASKRIPRYAVGAKSLIAAPPRSG